MADRITPWIGSTGTYEVRPPFSLEGGAEYTCSGVLSFAAALERGIDVFKQLYEPLGLSEVIYQEDLGKNAHLVVLSSLTVATIYVPDTYIASYPNLGLVPYSHIVLSASLGPLPDTVQLDHVKEAVGDAIADSLGVNAALNVHRMETTGTFTEEQSRIIEAQRQSRVTLTGTNRERLLKANEEKQQLLARINVLNEIIINGGLAVGVDVPEE